MLGAAVDDERRGQKIRACKGSCVMAKTVDAMRLCLRWNLQPRSADERRITNGNLHIRPVEDIRSRIEGGPLLKRRSDGPNRLSRYLRNTVNDGTVQPMGATLAKTLSGPQHWHGDQHAR